MMRKSKFAAVTADNIKLVYLGRSLLQELSEDPDLFEEKVNGSYIRARKDPNDSSHSLSHQILQVTCARKRRREGKIYLRVSNMPNKFYLDSLSDSDLKEEECMDLMQKVKRGLIQQPTIIQLQEKASSLHVDIAKNWIARELRLLRRKITQACEKGLRHKLNYFVESEKLLRDPLQQSQFFEAHPTVQAEELDPIVEEEDGSHSDDQRRAKKRKYRGAGAGRSDGGNGGWKLSRFPLPNPFFPIEVTEASIKYSYVIIPISFLRTHLSVKNGYHDVVLRLPEGGNRWPVTIIVNALGGRINGGWKSFVKDNQLAPGNTCFFE